MSRGDLERLSKDELIELVLTDTVAVAAAKASMSRATGRIAKHPRLPSRRLIRRGRLGFGEATSVLVFPLIKAARDAAMRMQALA